ncbi:uncharacterized protein [Hemitrygon akajei]|uniref:uncharacterized protein isoform X1 n=1 Tax=Hemitrygon akajei TaxID=2704970 RepID=UPI003BF9D2BF
MRMKVLILSSCLFALASASPVRKARGLNSGSNELMSTLNTLNNPFGYRRVFPIRPINPIYNNLGVSYPVIARTFRNPFLLRRMMRNGVIILEQSNPQTIPLNMEMSMEDTDSIEDNQLQQVPLIIPQNELPVITAFDDPFGPGVDMNVVGFDHKNSGYPLTEVVNVEEPALIPQYVENMDSFGLNLADNQMIKGCNETAGLHEAVNKPTGLYFNQELVDQQESNGGMVKESQIAEVDLVDSKEDIAMDYEDSTSFNTGNKAGLIKGGTPGSKSESDNAASFIQGNLGNIKNEINSCKNFHCGHGKVCELSENGNPYCICQDMSTCPTDMPDLQNVCGTNNETYENHCQFYVSKCQLESTTAQRIHLDYVGPCKYITPCLNDELDEFPSHLRDWLKNILMQLHEQDLNSPGTLSQREHAAIKDIYTYEIQLPSSDRSLELFRNDFIDNYHLFVYPIHRQFKQLDQYPMDGYLTHSELAPLHIPLIPLEHCTSRFFTVCDADGDGNLSLREWGKCFGLKEEDIDPNYIFQHEY